MKQIWKVENQEFYFDFFKAEITITYLCQVHGWKRKSGKLSKVSEKLNEKIIVPIGSINMNITEL